MARIIDVVQAPDQGQDQMVYRVPESGAGDFRLGSQVVVRESRGAFEIDVDVAGTNRVPLAVELGFRRGGGLTGAVPRAGTTDAFLLREGMGEYRLGPDTIRFGPGRAEHTWTDLRGALPKLDALSVYLTGFTPFRTTLRIG